MKTGEALPSLKHSSKRGENLPQNIPQQNHPIRHHWLCHNHKCFLCGFYCTITVHLNAYLYLMPPLIWGTSVDDNLHSFPLFCPENIKATALKVTFRQYVLKPALWRKSSGNTRLLGRFIHNLHDMSEQFSLCPDTYNTVQIKSQTNRMMRIARMVTMV